MKSRKLELVSFLTIRTLDFEFTVKGTGLLRRLQRFTALIKDKKIERLYFEKERGVCDMTSAQTILKDIT